MDRWKISGLRNEVLAFLRNENVGHEYHKKLEESQFLKNLDFLRDLTTHLNVLNLKLQGKNQNISHNTLSNLCLFLNGHIEGFCKKLDEM